MPIYSPPNIVDENPQNDQKHVRLWAVTYNTLDYPKQYVARLFYNDTPTSSIIISDQYEIIERHMLEQHLHRMPRSPGDDSVIVETWL